MKRAAIYVRVSTEEQKKKGLSVDAQLQALMDYCAKNDYSVVSVYNDAGISARKRYTRRPELLRLIADCDDKKIDIILFTKLDRWFRSVADYYEVQRHLDANGVTWRAIWEDYETETSSGVFKVNIMLSVAQNEADRTSERIKSVNEFKRLNGDYIGLAPCGYRKTKHLLEKNEEEEKAIEEFFHEYLNSFSINNAVRSMHKNGIRICRESAMYMLKNHTYAGMSAGGCKCDPYITEEEYQKIQISLSSRKVRSPKSQNDVYLFSGGLMRCAECGGLMVASYRNKTQKFYRCSAAKNLLCDNRHTIREDALETFLLDNLGTYLDAYNTSISARDKASNKANNEVKELERKLKRIGDRYEDGDISREEYKAKRDAIKARIDELKLLAIPMTEKTLPSGWRETYDSLDRPHRRAFWYSTILQIKFSSDKSVDVLL